MDTSENSAALFFAESADASPPESKPAPARRINPYKMFVGSFIPNWLLKQREISQGGKLIVSTESWIGVVVGIIGVFFFSDAVDFLGGVQLTRIVKK